MRPDREYASRQAARLSAAMSNIRVDAATAEVVRALDVQDIRALLLKGRALSDWYGADRPLYNDVDLWVAPADAERAERVLVSLGYEPVLAAERMPGWWQEHAGEWRRASDGTAVDLHRTLQGIGVGASEAWSLLFPFSQQIEVGGYPVLRLGTAARVFYVTVHAAHHGEMWSKSSLHLQAALRAVEPQAWVEAAALAHELLAVEEFATGLRLLPEGAELAARLGLPAHASSGVRLQASSPPPIARGFEQLSGARGGRRVTILARKVIPPAPFIRVWWPPAARGRIWLAAGYLYRPLWLLLKAPAGWRAWRSIRRG